jgi:hypothetical protein
LTEKMAEVILHQYSCGHITLDNFDMEDYVGQDPIRVNATINDHVELCPGCAAWDGFPFGADPPHPDIPALWGLEPVNLRQGNFITAFVRRILEFTDVPTVEEDVGIMQDVQVAGAEAEGTRADEDGPVDGPGENIDAELNFNDWIHSDAYADSSSPSEPGVQADGATQVRDTTEEAVVESQSAVVPCPPPTDVPVPAPSATEPPAVVSRTPLRRSERIANRRRAAELAARGRVRKRARPEGPLRRSERIRNMALKRHAS